MSFSEGESEEGERHLGFVSLEMTVRADKRPFLHTEPRAPAPTPATLPSEQHPAYCPEHFPFRPASHYEQSGKSILLSPTGVGR